MDKKFLSLLTILMVLINGTALAAISVYEDNLAGFNAEVGTPSVTINFDSYAAGSVITGDTITGVTFTSPYNTDPNSLEVVIGLNTYTDPDWFSLEVDATTNKLYPTSGTNVLSPGGIDLVGGDVVEEHDSLQLDFAVPVYAFGIDLLFQSYDYNLYTSYSLYDSSLNQIASDYVGGTGGSGGSPGGALFIGFVSDDLSTHISRIVFTEGDSTADYPDSNIGYDTLRVYPSAAVPVPTTFSLLGLGLIAFSWIGRKK